MFDISADWPKTTKVILANISIMLHNHSMQCILLHNNMALHESNYMYIGPVFIENMFLVTRPHMLFRRPYVLAIIVIIWYCMCMFSSITAINVSILCSGNVE